MLRFGIIGTNFISEWFAAACRATAGRARVEAVCSRDLVRARAFARQIEAPSAFDDLAAMTAAVDAVYVASPNSAHHAQAMTAIAAGRHVLVEKTLGVSATETREILAAAEQQRVIAMEAVRNVHTPAHRLIRDALPHLGTLRYARIEKLQYSSRYDRFRTGDVDNAFNPALGNSALADIGVYCLQPALDLFGLPPRTSGASVWLSNGFEAGGSLQLDYGSLVADVAYSKIVAGLGPSVIHGEDASLVFDDPAELSRLRLLWRGGSSETLVETPTVKPADTMVHELTDFLDQVDAGVTDARWSDLSLASRRVMDDHLAQHEGP